MPHWMLVAYRVLLTGLAAVLLVLLVLSLYAQIASSRARRRRDIDRMLP